MHNVAGTQITRINIGRDNAPVVLLGAKLFHSLLAQPQKQVPPELCKVLYVAFEKW